jgi:hypothetical protein
MFFEIIYYRHPREGGDLKLYNAKKFPFAGEGVATEG